MKPKEVYFVEVVRGTGMYRVEEGRRRGLRYGQKGGGLFSTLRNAMERQRNIGQQGVETVLWKSNTEWKRVDDV